MSILHKFVDYLEAQASVLNLEAAGLCDDRIVADARDLYKGQDHQAVMNSVQSQVEDRTVTDGWSQEEPYMRRLPHISEENEGMQMHFLVFWCRHQCVIDVKIK
ncbi:hypothetical protein BGZ96_005107 [Linnemannia gamsii]|uniref:Uncharacterized protein n=1 Tax=Linnemannia gamsii TaxID=64522 RepID=A0ABQ7K7B8_9FUNG|nr:hypothetical protein BGZ96_005107 [Linnemannia gamsii]